MKRSERNGGRGGVAHGSSQSLFALVLGLVEGRDGLSLFLFLWVGYLLLGCRILMKTEEGLGFQCNMFIRGNNYLIKLKLFVTIRKYLRGGAREEDTGRPVLTLPALFL